jgi:hypothetical protein
MCRKGEKADRKMGKTDADRDLRIEFEKAQDNGENRC